jgi:transposase
MNDYVSFDVHKHYTLAEREDKATGKRTLSRIEHARGAIKAYVSQLPKGTVVAVEATGNWYWIIEEIEAGGGLPTLVNPRKAKLMMGCLNKSDKLDVHNLNTLQRNGTLPTVWIATAPVRDLRELTRGRMVLSAQSTRLKNRILANFTKFGHLLEEASDAFGAKGRRDMDERVWKLPEHARFMMQMLLDHVDQYQTSLQQVNERLDGLVQETPEMILLKTLPYVGRVLSAVMTFELGPVSRFPTAGHLAAYAGTTPRVHSSADKFRRGPVRPDVNRYLRWAYVEAANLVVLNSTRNPLRRVSQLYRRIKMRRDHGKAVVAVARHLAEASWHVLSRQEPYREPSFKAQVEPGRCKREAVMSAHRLEQ